MFAAFSLSTCWLPQLQCVVRSSQKKKLIVRNVYLGNFSTLSYVTGVYDRALNRKNVVALHFVLKCVTSVLLASGHSSDSIHFARGSTLTYTR